jgi:hypothetical protein
VPYTADSKQAHAAIYGRVDTIIRFALRNRALNLVVQLGETAPKVARGRLPRESRDNSGDNGADIQIASLNQAIFNSHFGFVGLAKRRRGGRLHDGTLQVRSKSRDTAAHMVAGHNALRGSGPGQKLAFNDAMAHCGLS